MFSVAALTADAKWKQIGDTIVGGHGGGDALNQLKRPSGLYVDKDQTVIMTDYDNHRVLEWKQGDTCCRKVAGGNEPGDRMDQLNGPTDVIIDEETNSLIISDQRNRRVMKWSR